MIRQETTPDLINRISNDPSVRDNVCYRDGAMDWTPAFPPSVTGIIVLSDGEDACGVFVPTAPRAYQVHTLFGPGCRGREAIATAAAMLDHMKHHADRIWGATPVKNCAARWFNRQLGAMPERRDVYAAEGEVEIFALELKTWSHPLL